MIARLEWKNEVEKVRLKEQIKVEFFHGELQQAHVSNSLYKELLNFL